MHLSYFLLFNLVEINSQPNENVTNGVRLLAVELCVLLNCVVYCFISVCVYVCVCV